MPLKNVPDALALDEVALRLHFDAWSRAVLIFEDFLLTFEQVDIGDIDGLHGYKDEWNEYVEIAQNELASILTIAQQASELRMKAILCAVSPYLLLLNGAVPLKFSTIDVDFSEQRTLDAVDLPGAVKTLTNFPLLESYLEKYSYLRKLRNKYAHLGVGHTGLRPRDVIDVLCEQYVHLWPDGRWLSRRTMFDGSSARRFFHDGRYSSAQDIVMNEIRYAFELISSKYFKKLFGHTKGKINGHCPACIYEMASKVGEDPHPVAVQTSKGEAKCLMCEQVLVISTLPETLCELCSSSETATVEDFQCCFRCGCKQS